MVEESLNIAHSGVYLQSLRARLRSGRCLVRCPPDLCAQPEKVSLGEGVNICGTNSAVTADSD